MNPHLSNQKLYHKHEEHFKNYICCQEKYKDTIRESDKIIIATISFFSNRKLLRVLDIGYSKGNLLLHLKNNINGLKLYGGDLNKEQAELCKQSEDLNGIGFFQ